MGGEPAGPRTNWRRTLFDTLLFLVAACDRREATAACHKQAASIRTEQQSGPEFFSRLQSAIEKNQKKDDSHQKITPQLRRKTMQWLRRRSEPCEL
jgi:alpha-mannosidase